MLKPLPENSERVLPYLVIWIHTGPRVDTPLLDRAFLDQEFSDPDDLSLQFVASSCAAQLIWVWICCGWQWSEVTFWSCICMCIRVTDIICRNAIQSFCKFCYLLWTTVCCWAQFCSTGVMHRTRWMCFFYITTVPFCHLSHKSNPDGMFNKFDSKWFLYTGDTHIWVLGSMWPQGKCSYILILVD